jgi:hypothetical protein
MCHLVYGKKAAGLTRQQTTHRKSGAFTEKAFPF